MPHDTRWPMVLRPEQLDHLRLWPAPDDDVKHSHAIDPGARCSSVIIREADRAQCVRCGRVWVQPLPRHLAPLLTQPAETLQQELAQLDVALVALAGQQRAIARDIRHARDRRQLLLKLLTLAAA